VKNPKLKGGVLCEYIAAYTLLGTYMCALQIKVG